MTDFSYVSLIVIMFFAMMSPGPDMFLLIRNGMTYPRRAALASVLGIASGLSVHVSISVLGLALILASNDLLFHIVQTVGALYLVYLGIMSFREHPEFVWNDSENENQLAVNWLRGFREGLLCNLLNPKVTLFILSVFTQIIPPALPPLHKFSYGLLMILESIVVWSAFVIIIQTKAVQRYLDRFRLVITRVFGVLLLGLGLRLLTTWVLNG